MTHPGPRDLVDPFDRVVRDLRISVTDRCNFRCTYCMPEEGMQWMPRSEILTFEEIERLARICVDRYGFDGIRLTGGEPTIRAHITRLVAKLAALGVDLAMTTNGATLRNLAHDLRQAGLNRINISLDTLDRDKFARMTRRDELANVLEGIAVAKQAGFDRVKINAVVERGTNDDEIIDLARFGRDQGVEVRFIEFMPLDASDEWQRAKVVGQDEIVVGDQRRVADRARAGDGRRPGQPVALPRRQRHGRRDPHGHQAVLRRLRPGPAHRRWPVPHLPVRDRRVRHA